MRTLQVPCASPQFQLLYEVYFCNCTADEQCHSAPNRSFCALTGPMALLRVRRVVLVNFTFSTPVNDSDSPLLWPRELTVNPPGPASQTEFEMADVRIIASRALMLDCIRTILADPEADAYTVCVDFKLELPCTCLETVCCLQLPVLPLHWQLVLGFLDAFVQLSGLLRVPGSPTFLQLLLLPHEAAFTSVLAQESACLFAAHLLVATPNCS